VGLPDGNGLDLLRELRRGAHPTLPVLMLSAHGEEIDRVLGLELGADDYLPKPFSPRELAARVKALLRRAAAPAAAAPPVFHDDAAGQRIFLHGQPLALTRREYRLLSTLLAGAGRIHAREALLAAAWGDDSESTDRTVDTHIKTLRAKLREADPAREYISTHRGMGYCLDV
jgi:two-component system catabolic regulation response regulator CreB